MRVHDPLFDSDRSVIKFAVKNGVNVVLRTSKPIWYRGRLLLTEVLSYLYETILNKNISDCDIAEFENLFKQARSCPRKIYKAERAIKSEESG
jgi:hypothetical protein